MMKRIFAIALFIMLIVQCNDSVESNINIKYGKDTVYVKSNFLPDKGITLETTYLDLNDTIVNGYVKKYDKLGNLILWGTMYNSAFVGNVYHIKEKKIVYSEFFNLKNELYYQSRYNDNNINRKWNRRTPQFSFVPFGGDLLIDVFTPYYGEDERKIKITDDKGVELVNEVCVDPYNSIKIPYDDRTYIAELLYIKDGEVKLVDTTNMKYLKSMLEENKNNTD